MKKAWLLLITLLSTPAVFAQNLLSNGNFENYTTCPTTFSELDKATTWYPYTQATPDYMHSCNGGTLTGTPVNFAGYQAPASGQGYAGGYAFTDPTDPSSWKELIMTDGFAPLTVGAAYEISMSVSLANSSGWGCDDMGVILNANGPSTYPAISSSPPRTPQVDFKSYGAIVDTQNWVRISKVFIADSAYTSMAIGCFSPGPAMTSVVSVGSGSYCYYFIDSVVLRIATPITVNYTANDLCGGQQITVPYVFNGIPSFGSSNVFTVQLSSATGSFATPTNIGSVASTSAGSITATIPAGAAGTGYRIRIVSSSPVDSSLPSPVDIRITPPHTVTALTNAPVCEGDTLFLNSSASVTGVSYAWTGPNAYSEVLQNTYLTPIASSQAGEYVIRTARNACVASDTLNVIVKPVPVLTLTSNSPVCPGTTMMLTATSSLTGTNISWVGPNSFSSTIANPTRTPTGYADIGVYTAFAEKNGCHSEANIPVNVQITTATPDATNNGPLCMGAALNLSATCATPGVSYIWTGPDNFRSNLQNPVINPSAVINDGKYIVVAVVNGCYSLPDTTDAVIYPDPYLGNYASPNDTVCEGTVVTFVTVPMNGVINPTFQWFKNGVPVPGETNLTFISPYATGDTFYCRTYCQNNCGDNLTLYSNKVGMTILPVINHVSAKLSSIPEHPLPGQPVTFRATVESGGYTPQFQWQKNGKDVWSATYAIWSTDKLAPYDKINCIVTTSDPCANTMIVSSDTMEVNFATNVDQLAGNDALQLYPNPNDGSFRLKTQNVKCTSIDVLNVTGQVVYQNKPEVPQAEYTINLAQQLPAGTYMLRVYDGERYYRKSFTVNR